MHAPDPTTLALQSAHPGLLIHCFESKLPSSSSHAEVLQACLVGLGVSTKSSWCSWLASPLGLVESTPWYACLAQGASHSSSLPWLIPQGTPKKDFPCSIQNNKWMIWNGYNLHLTAIRPIHRESTQFKHPPNPHRGWPTEESSHLLHLSPPESTSASAASLPSYCLDLAFTLNVAGMGQPLRHLNQ